MLPAESNEPVRWLGSVEGYESSDYLPWGLDELAACLADQRARVRLNHEALLLDLIVRYPRERLAELRRVLAAQAEPDWFSAGRTHYLARHWAITGETQRCYLKTTRTTVISGGIEVHDEQTSQWLPSAPDQFTDALIQETLERLGTIDELLSTPSRDNGELALTELVARLRRANGWGRHDLVQALLRLEPTSPAETTLLDGLRLVGADGLDAAEVVRDWIAGISQRESQIVAGRPIAGPLELPLPGSLMRLAGLAEMCAAVEVGDERGYGMIHPARWLGVLPHDAEGCAALIAQRGDQDSSVHARVMGWLIWSAGPIGTAVHWLVARQLIHPNPNSRRFGAQDAAELASQGRLDAELLAQHLLAFFEAGELSLTRAVDGWRRLVDAAGLAVIWPAWYGVLDAACSASRKPAGLAELLQATTEVIDMVKRYLPDDPLPDSVAVLAAQRGSSRAVAEARVLHQSAG